MYIHHILEDKNKFRHIYDIDRLTDIDKWCRRDIERLEEAISKIKEYQMNVFNHVQEVLQTDIKKVVVIARHQDWSSKKVHYNVKVEHRPQVKNEFVDNEKVYGKYSDLKSFKGTERHIALKYANELSKQYHCPIERKGF